jgi:hypothetical protein
MSEQSPNKVGRFVPIPLYFRGYRSYAKTFTEGHRLSAALLVGEDRGDF